MQTTISQYGAPAFKGMLDGVGPRNVRSYAAEEAIPVSYPVKLGTIPDKEVLKATAGAGVVGGLRIVILASHAGQARAGPGRRRR